MAGTHSSVETSPNNSGETPSIDRAGVSAREGKQAMHTSKRRNWKPRKDRCIFKDRRGRWHIDYYTPNGARRRKLVDGSKTDAERELRRLRGAIDAGEFVDAHTSPTFAQFSVMFMERHGSKKLSYAKNSRVLERLKEFFGTTKIARITADHIEQYRLKRRSEPDERDGKSALADTTINREVEVLRAMFSKAVAWGKLAKNPARAVEDYAEDNKRERYLETVEVRKLLRAAKRSYSEFLRPAIYLALETGTRKSELLGLLWSDVRFESSEILLRDTKSGEPRHVPMSRRARWCLSKLAARNPLATWVFESEGKNGAKAPIRDTKTAWNTALTRAKIEDFHWHDLRHTFASHFAMKGGNLYALATILGHSNPKITIDRYAHLSPAYVNEQRHVMDRTLRGSNGHSMDTRAVSAGSGSL